MSTPNTHGPDALPPALLAAYADGELTPSECARVEAWLADHPEAAADVEAQRRLARLFDEAAPSPPAEDDWSAVLAGVERDLTAPARRPAWRRRAAVALGVFVAAAAAVLLALLLKGGSPAPAPAPPQPDPVEPWQFARDDEVQIISMDDRDRETLVVGQAPAAGQFEWVNESEVKVWTKTPNDEGEVGELWVPADGAGPPMFVMPPR